MLSKSSTGLPSKFASNLTEASGSGRNLVYSSYFTNDKTEDLKREAGLLKSLMRDPENRIQISCC